MPSLPYKPAGLLRTDILLPLEWGFALVLGHPRGSGDEYAGRVLYEMKKHPARKY